MAASIVFDQVGLPAGTPGARTDGLDTGALVTVRNASGKPCVVQLLWVPPEDTSAVASLTQVAGDTWTFAPQALRYGSYRVRLIEDFGLSTQTTSEKIFGIRMPLTGILIPAHNEGGDRSVSLASTPDQINAAVAVTDNDVAFAGMRWLGWWPAIKDMMVAFEVGVGGSDYATMAALRTAPPVNNKRVRTLTYSTAKDSGGGEWVGTTGNAPGTYTHNGGTVVVPSGGDGSAAWLRQYFGPVFVEWFGASPTASASTNTTAINAAAATLAMVSALPGRTFPINGTIVARQGFDFAGPVTFQQTGAATVMTAADDGCVFRNLRLLYSYASPSTAHDGLYLDNVDGAIVENYTAQGFAGEALRLQGCTNVTVTSPRFLGAYAPASGSSVNSVLRDIYIVGNASRISITDSVSTSGSGISIACQTTLATDRQRGISIVGCKTSGNRNYGFMAYTAANSNDSTQACIEVEFLGCDARNILGDLESSPGSGVKDFGNGYYIQGDVRVEFHGCTGANCNQQTTTDATLVAGVVALNAPMTAKVVGGDFESTNAWHGIDCVVGARTTLIDLDGPTVRKGSRTSIRVRSNAANSATFRSRADVSGGTNYGVLALSDTHPIDRVEVLGSYVGATASNSGVYIDRTNYARVAARVEGYANAGAHYENCARAIVGVGASFKTLAIGLSTGGGVPLLEFEGAPSYLSGVTTPTNLNAATKVGDVGGSGPIDVSWFGAKCDGTTDDTTAIQTALTNAQTSKRVVRLGVGTSKVTSKLTVPIGVTVVGHGMDSSTISCAHNGEGLGWADGTLNGSTASHSYLEDFTIERATANRAGQNNTTGGGLVQVAGTFGSATRVRVRGFRYAVVLDQSEVWGLYGCVFEGGAGTPSWAEAGVWVCNGPSHLVGSDPSFTNQITIEKCQFNLLRVGIVDEGGIAHRYSDNNFNGCTDYHAYLAGCSSVTFAENEIEGSAAPVAFAGSTLSIGLRPTPASVGYGRAVVQGNSITSNGSCLEVKASGYYALTLIGNFFYAAPGNPVVLNCAYSNEINGAGNRVYVDDTHQTEQDDLAAFIDSRPVNGVLDHYGWTLRNGSWFTKRAAAPTTGTWAVGDSVEHPSPYVGGFRGRVCTVAGTPGTWKVFGRIQTFDLAEVTGIELIAALWGDGVSIVGGSGIDSVIDTSGTANTMVQATALNRLGFTRGWLAGLSAALGGSGKYLQVADLAGANFATSTIFFVGERLNATEYLFDGSDATNRHACYVDNASVNMFAGSTLTAASAIAASTPFIGEFVFNGASASFRIEPHGGTPITASGNAGTAALQGATLMARYDGANACGGKVGLYVIARGVLDSTTRANIRSYLRTLTGIVHI